MMAPPKGTIPWNKKNDGLTVAQRFYRKHKDRLSEYRKKKLKESYGKHREKRLADKREYYKIEKERKRRRKVLVLTHYCGGVPRCTCCGIDLLDCLTLDHKDQNGAQHRKSVKTSDMYCWAVKNSFPEIFIVLCYNCNIAKFRNGGVCPHQKRMLV